MTARNKPIITGAIFCGGRSRRMGQPKAGIKLLNGRTMIEEVYKAMEPVCDEIVLVGHNQGLPAHLGQLILIQDNYPNCGPIAGLEALLASKRNEEYLTAPCDLFKANSKLFELLLHADAEAPVVLRHNRQLHPLIGRFNTQILALIHQQIKAKQLSMHQLLEKCKATVIDVPDTYGQYLVNANAPEDLHQD